MWSVVSSAFEPSSVTVWPFTVTMPDRMSSSACRREAIPSARDNFLQALLHQFRSNSRHNFDLCATRVAENCCGRERGAQFGNDMMAAIQNGPARPGSQLTRKCLSPASPSLQFIRIGKHLGWQILQAKQLSSASADCSPDASIDSASTTVSRASALILPTLVPSPPVSAASSGSIGATPSSEPSAACASCSNSFRLGSSSRSDRPKRIKNCFDVRYKNRSADHGLAARRGDEPLFEQRLDHPAHVHAANLVDLRHRRRLLVSNHGERLKRRHRQANRRLQALDEFAAPRHDAAAWCKTSSRPPLCGLRFRDPRSDTPRRARSSAARASVFSTPSARLI